MLRRKVDDRVALGHPERDVIKCVWFHRGTLAMAYRAAQARNQSFTVD
jgi:hypothetical protein